MRTLAPTLLALTALALLPACRFGGVRSVEAENDRLRQEVADHEKTQRALEGEVAELKIKLAEATRSSTLPPDALEALPRVNEIEISSLSGFEPPDPAKPASEVSVWFETRDGRGRFVQAVGTVTIDALVLPADVGEGQDNHPQRIATLILTPAQVRDAYRSSFTGTHYAATVKLEKPIERGPGKTPSLVIRVEFQDAITGELLKGERVISHKAAPTAAAAGRR